MTQEFIKTIGIELGGLEEITLAFGPHASGTLEYYHPLEVPANKLTVQHEVILLNPSVMGGPMYELLKIKANILLEDPVTFKVLHKFPEGEEFYLISVKQLLVVPEKKVVLTK
ncbi:MAG TPA: hypothetical protein VNT75_24500 [Symbiobacteriaceae bacterium]|nr:hypothetical protein [Symbiobacteriaceae bacterium]